MHYSGGVISDPSCTYGSNSDHIILAIGFGTDQRTGLDYYLVRNSWGTSWGEQGYGRIARTGDGIGICGIQIQGTYSRTN